MSEKKELVASRLDKGASFSSQLFTEEIHIATSATFTILYSIFSVGAVVSALIIARQGKVLLSQIVRGAAAMGIAMLLLSATRGIATAIPAAFLVGMASILYMTSTTAIVQVGTKRELQGRLLALQTVFVALRITGRRTQRWVWPSFAPFASLQFSTVSPRTGPPRGDTRFSSAASASLSDVSDQSISNERQLPPHALRHDQAWTCLRTQHGGTLLERGNNKACNEHSLKDTRELLDECGARRAQLG